MKKATTYIGIALLGSIMMSFSGTPDCKTNCEPLPIDEIIYIEPQEDLELDFDTEEYLPEDFNAYEGMGTDLTDIVFIEEEEEIDLGFDPKAYLPIGFDAYKGMEIDLETVEYIEEDEDVELEFNVQHFLPEDFDAYSS
ncbi:hypothetical protein RQM65_02335 [Pricia sp. S334]|uniref:Uncharacterized protein n=1 Tax=Pricia mediterranea TaxID=3076079 RepID=A0ABU3L1B3_9FLAO|nr:hypothetical protein [Pricia sp. S334]MDT7827501.1 hypothetical protein [Pricia sp. S334]